MSHDKLEYWLIFQNDRLLINKNTESNRLLTATAIVEIKKYFSRQNLLSQFTSHDIYCAEINAEFPVPETLEFISFKKALGLIDAQWYNIAAKAYAIINWDKNHQYCGRCASKTIHKANTFERYCPACTLSFYPRISPSVIVLIHRGDEILMARGHHFIPGAFGLIAGFVEAGESVEDAVHRETQEEVGIKIKHLRYFDSQSWPFPDSLMIAFTAEYASGELTINPVEIEVAGWYRYDQLPGRPSASISIASKLIDYFIAQKKQSSLK